MLGGRCGHTALNRSARRVLVQSEGVTGGMYLCTEISIVCAYRPRFLQRWRGKKLYIELALPKLIIRLIIPDEPPDNKKREHLGSYLQQFKSYKGCNPRRFADNSLYPNVNFIFPDRSCYFNTRYVRLIRVTVFDLEFSNLFFLDLKLLMQNSYCLKTLR